MTQQPFLAELETSGTGLAAQAVVMEWKEYAEKHNFYEATEESRTVKMADDLICQLALIIDGEVSHIEGAQCVCADYILLPREDEVSALLLHLLPSLIRISSCYCS